MCLESSPFKLDRKTKKKTQKDVGARLTQGCWLLYVADFFCIKQLLILMMMEMFLCLAKARNTRTHARADI